MKQDIDTSHVTLVGEDLRPMFAAAIADVQARRATEVTGNEPAPDECLLTLRIKADQWKQVQKAIESVGRYKGDPASRAVERLCEMYHEHKADELARQRIKPAGLRAIALLDFPALIAGVEGPPTEVVRLVTDLAGQVDEHEVERILDEHNGVKP